MSEVQQATPGAATTTTVAEPNLLEQIVEQGRFGQEPATRERGRNLIKEFLAQVLQGEVTPGKDTEQMINQRIAQIDHLVSLQLNEVMHHTEFQKLEGSWRGLKFLLDNSETSTMLKIRVINASKKELLRDLQKATEFDQSAVFKKVYEDEYGIFGGEPFGAIIGDYEFTKHPEDIELLDKMSHVAAAAHAPFFTAAGPQLLSLDSYTNLGQPRDISKIFESTEYAKWKGFRESEDSRYVGLCMPRVLMRLPWGPDTKAVEGFDYREDVDGTDHEKYLWGNAAYAMGTCLTRAFAQHGWCVAIRGVEGGGMVDALPAHTFRTDEGDIALKCPTEVAITDRREKELADNGFIPLVHCKGRDYAAFFSVQSAQKPKLYDKDDATANARLSAQLPYLMATCRFAHYLKSMMRDRIGSFTSRDECERFLHRWINGYTTSLDDASQAQKAARPLRQASVEVLDVPGKPGAYRAVAFLRPHFQLDEIGISLRLVADLPAGKG